MAALETDTREVATLSEIARRLGCPASSLSSIATGVPHALVDGLHLWPVEQIIALHAVYTATFGTIRRFRRGHGWND